MVERLAEKYKSPEARGDESYNRDSNAAQVSDDILDNSSLLTGKCTFQPTKTLEKFTATVMAASVAIFDSADLSSFGKSITLFDVKTLTISSDAVATVEIKVEDEANAVGAGTAIYTFFMDANQTITVPFGFGDGGSRPPLPLSFSPFPRKPDPGVYGDFGAAGLGLSGVFSLCYRPHWPRRRYCDLLVPYLPNPYVSWT